MNYFPFHIGDYTTHTAHLEPMEDLAFRRLMDLYYLREGALPADIAECARLIRLKSYTAEVEAVLKEFFLLTNEGWMNVRCAEELGKMKDKQQKAKASAQASVNARSTNAQRTLNERSPDVELPTPTPTPIEIHMSPAKLPTCPHQSLIDLYHQVLPELPIVKIQSDQRSRAISGFWKWILTSKRSDGQPRATSSAEALEWVQAYFERARDNDFLMGKTTQTGKHAGWVCDFDFLLTEKGKKQVIEKTKDAND